ncbi:MAG: DNA-binding protein [Microvirga sp.]|nr:DNA-binding protein [Microvirga sp.]
MNKGELVAAVADKVGLSRGQAGDAIDAAIEAITGALKKGDEVKIVGFGTFVVTNRAAGEARNPRTGEKVKVPASKTFLCQACRAVSSAGRASVLHTAGRGFDPLTAHHFSHHGLVSLRSSSRPVALLAFRQPVEHLFRCLSLALQSVGVPLQDGSKHVRLNRSARALAPCIVL